KIGLEKGSRCNNITDSTKPMSFPLQVLVGSFLTILIVFTLCGNIVVCLAVTLDRRLRSLTNCIIVSLAITDLLLLTHEWPFGSTLCNIYSSLDVMLCTASILNLLMISLDRYFAVTTPLRYRQVVTPSRVAVGLVIIWAVSLMVSFLPIHLGWNTNGTAVQNTTPNCTKTCDLEVNPIYGLIAREQAKRINHTWYCSSNSPMPPMVKEHKATVTLAVVLGAFVVCWFPYFTVFTYRGVWGNSGVKGAPMSIVLWLGYANSALNPILYGTLNRDFRVAYQHLLHCWRTGGSQELPPVTPPEGAAQGQELQELAMPCFLGAGRLARPRALGKCRCLSQRGQGVLSPGRRVSGHLWSRCESLQERSSGSPSLALRVLLSAPTRAPGVAALGQHQQRAQPTAIPFPSLERSKNNQN
uniref:Histamine receptor H2 n=1 Tax=Anas platyrhynchos TaxID=8839 RepID=A0A8B9T6C5_ANAPL